MRKDMRPEKESSHHWLPIFVLFSLVSIAASNNPVAATPVQCEIDDASICASNGNGGVVMFGCKALSAIGTTYAAHPEGYVFGMDGDARATIETFVRHHIERSCKFSVILNPKKGRGFCRSATKGETKLLFYLSTTDNTKANITLTCPLDTCSGIEDISKIPAC